MGYVYYLLGRLRQRLGYAYEVPTLGLGYAQSYTKSIARERLYRSLQGGYRLWHQGSLAWEH